MTSQVTIFGNLPKVRRGPCLGVTDVGVLQIALDNQNSDSFGLNPFLTFFMSYNSPARPSTYHPLDCVSSSPQQWQGGEF